MNSFGRRFAIPALCALLSSACSDGNGNNRPAASQPATLQMQTLRIPSVAQPSQTPGSPGVTVTNPKLLQQFGSGGPDLNQAVYTRYYLSDAQELQADAIVVLMPGFEGGATNFAVLADQLMRRLRDEATMVVEVWAMDRRSELLEDRVGLELAESERDAQLGLDFLFGEQLGLELDPRLQDGPNRRLITYNNGSDVPFIANWTTLVHSQDIDAVVARAQESARSGNVFLGGHSAGTGFAARYAATDLALDSNTVEAGYRKLRGLILLEGGDSRLAEQPDPDTLDRIEARFDDGLGAAAAPFLATSIGALGPEVDGVTTWLNTANDGEGNNVIGPLVQFIQRNSQ